MELGHVMGGPEEQKHEPILSVPFPETHLWNVPSQDSGSLMHARLGPPSQALCSE